MLLIHDCFPFCNGQLGVSGHPEDCIGTKDIEELWEQMDTDGDGVIDLSDFSVCPRVISYSVKFFLHGFCSSTYFLMPYGPFD